MIVADASVIIDLLLDLDPHAATIRRALAREGMAIPHLLDCEVGQVLRRLVRRQEIGCERAEQAIDDLLSLPLVRYEHRPLLGRAFQLRDNATFYDGVYLALAEALDTSLLTRDRALGALPGLGRRVRVLA